MWFEGGRWAGELVEFLCVCVCVCVYNRAPPPFFGESRLTNNFVGGWMRGSFLRFTWLVGLLGRFI